ncbi:phage tail protein [Candidatus Pantoea alvi]|nr:phage tail protein [Pantoea alvi]
MTVENSVTLDENGLAESAGSITVYNFDPETGLFIGSSQEYMVSGVGVPAHSTAEAPPTDVVGKVCLFSNNSWQQVDDHRGETVYSTADGSAVIISSVGDYPESTTLLKPATAYDVWNGAEWVTDLTAQHTALVAAANVQKASYISEANSKTQAWQTQLLLGIITDEDKASLTIWMEYIQAVQAVDVSQAPDITWPISPEEESS